MGWRRIRKYSIIFEMKGEQVILSIGVVAEFTGIFSVISSVNNFIPIIDFMSILKKWNRKWVVF